ncbi:Replication factor C subunit 5 [Phytophthora cinnamomi]|uniref:Replication factor C subunit 5 n=1 Tax=Phytophthora cinnamomi TaxID=4785 RepID=UPI003559F3E8|nr:Replication factor C subunit 5 [Phytophthora cinnamomi]
MATPKPSKNPISSTKESKTIGFVALKKYPFQISNKGIRHLRLTMNTTIASTGHLPEAFEVIFASLAERCKCRIGLEDIR